MPVRGLQEILLSVDVVAAMNVIMIGMDPAIRDIAIKVRIFKLL
jgi:hypothetical protein